MSPSFGVSKANQLPVVLMWLRNRIYLPVQMPNPRSTESGSRLSQVRPSLITIAFPIGSDYHGRPNEWHMLNRLELACR